MNACGLLKLKFSALSPPNGRKTEDQRASPYLLSQHEAGAEPDFEEAGGVLELEPGAARLPDASLRALQPRRGSHLAVGAGCRRRGAQLARQQAARVLSEVVELHSSCCTDEGSGEGRESSSHLRGGETKGGRLWAEVEPN